MIGCSAFQEWPVKKITIVRDINTRLHLSHMGKPLSKKLYLQEQLDHLTKIILHKHPKAV